MPYVKTLHMVYYKCKQKQHKKEGGENMNIIKVLENQIEKGNEHIDLDGNILSLDKMKKKSLKDYNSLVKSGDIDPYEKSFKEYFTDDIDQYLPVDYLIDFIKGGQVSVDLEEQENNEQ